VARLRGLSSALRLLALLALAPLSPSLPLPARGQEATGPFALTEWRVPGRVVDAFVARGEDGRDVVFAISLSGSAPAERRFVTPLPADLKEPARPIEAPVGVVAVDAAELGRAPGPELVWLAASELRITSLRGELLERRPLEPPLPLPPRTWELARLQLVRDWDADGRPEAAAPSAGGIRLLPLVPGDTGQELSLPLIADYGSPTLENFFRPGLLVSLVLWPSLALADDDGDGRLDLFATNRYALSVFRAGPAGLPREPSRVRRFRPFSPEEERRHVASTLLATPRDLDGDGRADLVVHRMVGELMRSRSTTTLFRNGGDGADPQAEPSARIERSGGNAAMRIDDVDGDGRLEMLEAYLGFGVLQLVRILTLGRVELRLRVLTLPDSGEPVETWSDDVSFPFDFSTSRVLGVLPYIGADWNGDGRLDLCWGEGDGKLRFRLGEQRPDGPGFGRSVASQPLELTGDLLAADLDADGLLDFVGWDALDEEGRLRVGRNLGLLPGSAPALRAAPPD
jgi:FG-GAP-like repeat